MSGAPVSEGHDERRFLIVTIDGPAGTGKSTVAHRLADRLGLQFLDTGAMYRAAALIAVEQEIDPENGPAVAEAVRRSEMHFDWTTSPPRLLLGERCVDGPIRGDEVARVVSIVAAQKPIREVLVQHQRRIADAHPRLVTEGRDQGSVVFPDAPVRFYLDADVSERARRRIAQLARGGAAVDETKVLSGLRERDRIDSTRPDGPLIRPHGAIVVDTTDLTLDEVVDRLEEHVRTELPDAGLRP
ncbi:MAG: (d)CMP kinase [Planctomycetes bacterium]|nr:(d)CMP kinase [Planctomycetota bacterium]